MGKTVEDLTGQKFNSLTVLSLGEDYISPKGGRIKQWICKCDCGNKNTILVTSSHLKRGEVKSCGCSRIKDLTGKKFHRLTVIKRTEKPSNKKYQGTYWLCKCDCGSNKEIIATTGELNSGARKSCGCINREAIIKFNKETKKKYNTYNLSGDYGIGYTSNGEEFYFDLDDYDKIKNYYWYKNNNEYIVADDYCGEKRFIQMHRLVMNCPDNMEIDHKYHNKNDNRKEFLRIVTRSQNQMNVGLKSHNSSGVTGVHWGNKEEKWIAQININGKRTRLGCFDNFDEAIQVRHDAELEYFGEYRYKNPAIGKGC